jgi:hypothetical protein
MPFIFFKFPKINLNTPKDRRVFLRDRVWSESDIILEKKPENKYFEDIVRNIFDKLDLADVNKDKLFVTAYDYMKAQGLEERDIGLFLTLFERGLNVLDVVERKRDELLRTIKVELSEQRKDITPCERDEELIEQLRREIGIVIKGVRCEVFDLMKDYLAEDIEQAEAEKSSFAGPYIRTLLDFHKGNRRYTDHLKEQLAKLLRTSTQAIAAMKAWKSGDLNGRSVTIDDLIEKSKSRISTKSQIVQIPKSQSVDVQKTASYKPNEEDLNTTYSFIPDNEHVTIAQSLQPDSFFVDEKKGFTRKQRRWIYSLFLLDLGDESGKVELRQHLANKIFKCTRPKISAITAYLSGKLIVAAEASKSEVWEDIRLITEQKDAIGAKRKLPGKNSGNDSGDSEGERSADFLEVQEINEDETLKVKSNDKSPAGGNSDTETDESVEIVMSYYGSGEHFDYNNEAKIEWRKALQAFIDRNTTSEERSKMRVLCLPGKKCLEIPVYTELGFNPANIVGVEGGNKEARSEFEKNAKALGIDYRIGKLEEDVLSGEAPFDIVSLDFLGQMCSTYIKIMNSIPYSGKPILCTNVQARRERLRSGYQYLDLPNIFDADSGFDFSKVDRIIPSICTSLCNAVTNMLNPKSTGETRDKALLNIAMLTLSSKMFEGYKLTVAETTPSVLGDILGDDYMANCGLSMAWFAPKLIFSMFFPQINPEELERDLSRIVKRAWFGFPRLLDYEIYKYKSEKSPFLSQFIKAESCAPVLIKVEKMIKFCLDTYAEGVVKPRVSHNSLPGKAEMDKMKREMDEMKKKADQVRIKMRAIMRIREIFEKGIKPQDIRRLRTLLVASGQKMYGRKPREIARTLELGAGSLSLEDIKGAVIEKYGLKKEINSKHFGISLEGLAEAMFGDGELEAIAITQKFGNHSTSIKLGDILSASAVIREFDSQDIYLKE